MVTKRELLDAIKQHRAEREALLAEVGDVRMTTPGVAGEWSVKDIIAHVAWYEWWSAEFIRTRTWPQLPDHLNSEDTDTRNDAYFMERRETPLAEILDEASHSYDCLITAIEALTAEEYADQTLLGMPEDPGWQVSKWIPENTYLHDEQHAPAVRA